MNRLVVNLLTAIVVISIGTAVYANTEIDENFDGGSVSFIDDTNGTFQTVNSFGNNFGMFELSYTGSGEALWSSLIFSGREISADTTYFSFDYKFEFEFNSPSSGPHAGKTLSNVLIEGADYLRISFLGDFDYELFKSSFDPNNINNQIVESPAAVAYGFSLPIVESPSVFLPGFTHIEIDLTDFITSENLFGETLDIYVEIINGNEYFDFINTNNLLTLDEFNTFSSVDNLYFGPQFSTVPEPSAVALSMLGILYMFRKIRKRSN